MRMSQKLTLCTISRQALRDHPPNTSSSSRHYSHATFEIIDRVQIERNRHRLKEVGGKYGGYERSMGEARLRLAL